MLGSFSDIADLRGAVFVSSDSLKELAEGRLDLV